MPLFHGDLPGIGDHKIVLAQGKTSELQLCRWLQFQEFEVVTPTSCRYLNTCRERLKYIYILPIPSCDSKLPTSAVNIDCAMIVPKM